MYIKYQKFQQCLRWRYYISVYPGLSIVFPGEVSSARQECVMYVSGRQDRQVGHFPQVLQEPFRSAPPRDIRYIMLYYAVLRRGTGQPGWCVGGCWAGGGVGELSKCVWGAGGLTCRYRWTRRPQPSSWRSHTCNSSRPYRVFTCPVCVNSDIIRQLGMRKHTLGYKNKSYRKHS